MSRRLMEPRRWRGKLRDISRRPEGPSANLTLDILCVETINSFPETKCQGFNSTIRKRNREDGLTKIGKFS